MAKQDAAKNFEFQLQSEWNGYNSTRDKTNIAENVLVRGSKNVYKKLSGTIANRPGQKRLGVANPILSKIPSEYVWNTSWGVTNTLVVSNSNLYVVKDNVWYSLLSGLTKTRYVFDKWWDNTEKKDRCLFVNGTDDIFHWSGGFANVSGLSGVVTSVAINLAGSGYVEGDIITISGGYANAKVVVTSTSTGGLVTGISLTDGGDGYSVNTNRPTTGGTGTGFTIDISTVASPSATTLTKKDVSVSWQQAGFASNNAGEKKIMIDGVEYTYTGGENTPTLTGVSPSAASIPDGEVAIQSVITSSNKPAALFLNDFLKVINNQVYVGSYKSRLCYISKNTDFSDFIVPTPRAPGDPEILTLDAPLKGIGVRKGLAYIGVGTSKWARISFANITVGTTLTQTTQVDIEPMSLLQAPYAHEFIDSNGDNLIYLSQDNQVRLLGNTNNSFTTVYSSISQEVATELSEEDFTGGGLRCIGEFVYLTAPNSGLTYLYQVRNTVDANNVVVAERLWHAPFTWNATRVDEIDGVVVCFSNANPQIYQVWNTDQYFDDSPSDEPLPYTCSACFGYRTNGRRQGLQSFDKFFSEGYISNGSPLDLQINYNYEGSTNIYVAPINSPSRPTTLFFNGAVSAASLGDSSLGDEPLGEQTSGLFNQTQTLSKFKNINMFSPVNCFEYQPIIYSDKVNAQWEIIAIGTNTSETEESATFIINKLRT